MAEVRNGFLHLLAKPRVYDAFQSLVGAYAWRERAIRSSCAGRLAAGAVVVDVGCGTAKILDYLPNGIQYIGLDRNEQYLESARQRFSERDARFLCEDLGAGDVLGGIRADAVLAIGLLHHLNDEECRQLIDSAARVLRDDGFMMTLDPVYCGEQSKLARAVVSRDRGRSVRTVKGYESLLHSCFRKVTSTVDLSPIRIPYTGVLIEAFK